MTQWKLKNKVQIRLLHLKCSGRWFVDSADSSHRKHPLHNEPPHPHPHPHPFLLHIMGQTSILCSNPTKECSRMGQMPSTTLSRANSLEPLTISHLRTPIMAHVCSWCSICSDLLEISHGSWTSNSYVRVSIIYPIWHFWLQINPWSIWSQSYMVDDLGLPVNYTKSLKSDHRLWIISHCFYLSHQ